MIDILVPKKIPNYANHSDWTGSVVERTEETVSFSAEFEKTVGIAVNTAAPKIVRLYIHAEDNTTIFDNMLVFTVYSSDSFKSADSIYRASGELIRTHVNGIHGSGNHNLNVTDEDGMEENDMIIIFGVQESKNRIAVLGVNQLTLEDETDEAYSGGEAVCKLLESGGFQAYSTSGENKLHIRLAFGSAQTVIVRVGIEYVV